MGFLVVLLKADLEISGCHSGQGLAALAECQNEGLPSASHWSSENEEVLTHPELPAIRCQRGGGGLGTWCQGQREAGLTAAPVSL